MFTLTSQIQFEYPLLIQKDMSGTTFSHFYCMDLNPDTGEAFFLGSTNASELGVQSGMDPLLLKYNELTEEIELLHTYKDIGALSNTRFHSCTLDDTGT